MMKSWNEPAICFTLISVLFALTVSFRISAAPILSATHEGSTQVRLSWSSTAGKQYKLRVKGVVEGAWSDFQTQPSPLVASGSQLSYLILATGGAQFFQVLEIGETTSLPVPDPEAVARQIVEGTTPDQVVKATSMALAAGGITVGDAGRVDLAAMEPAASWFVDPHILFNMATEAHNRVVSGRFTLADLGQLWQDMGFPFAGTGSPGDQLLNFLRTWLEDATSRPPTAFNFTPRFIAAMTSYQVPSIRLSDVSVQSGDVRLTLLEVDLLMATFDRLYQIELPPGTPPPDPTRVTVQSVGLAVPVGVCDEMKKFMGTIGTKAVQKVVSYGKETLTDGALGALGMTKTEIAQFKTYQKFFTGLDMAMKVVKLLQLYASTEVTLKVEGSDPIHKPHKDSARVLQTISATAGIPEKDWQNYQKNNSSQSFNDLKSCLGFAGMPLPLDLADIAKKVDSWRIKWEEISGFPKHAKGFRLDVNNFNAPGPFGMKLVSAGAASAKATLKLDLVEESPMASLFDGPLKKSPVVVKAKVFTADPPSPALLLKVTSLIGTVSALLDLSVGSHPRTWVELD